MTNLVAAFLVVSLTGVVIAWTRGNRKLSKLIQAVALSNMVAAIVAPLAYCVAALSLEGKLGMLKLFFPFVLPPTLAWGLFSILTFQCGKLFEDSFSVEDLPGMSRTREHEHDAEYANKGA